MDWNLDKARTTYNISNWGNGYFDINNAGHVVVHPNRNQNATGIDLNQLINELHQQGLSLPVLVRFPDILHDRVQVLCDAFAQAMEKYNYQAKYTAVYPIKVNQQRSVVEEIIAYGKDKVGLEAGSKPELMAVLALTNSAEGIVICNGYKDREYIRLALIGRRLGHKVTIVVEKLSELELIIEESKALNIIPLIGVRIRLASISRGKWQNTGGDKSKFGLSSAQLLAMVQHLREAELLDSLQLLHFHLGSQVANINDIQNGLREAARCYAMLYQMGVKTACVDVGGGLGVDYEGTSSHNFFSMNYSVQEYANTIVHSFIEVCNEHKLPHPDVVTESGRAMTAHHAVLITNVIDTEQVSGNKLIDIQTEADDPAVIKELKNSLRCLNEPSVIEVYHDVVHRLSVAQEMFVHGILSLEQRAEIEQLYFAICGAVQPLLQVDIQAHREILDELNEKLADKYFCNFSVFQSVPDVWAINQVFPIMPLHRLDKAPTRRAVITDITCDSDGRFDFYVDNKGIESTLPLHPINDKEPYWLGIFLVGAYQEILGDMHNLFGDTNSVNVVLRPDGGHRILKFQPGDTVDSVLRYVNFDTEELLVMYQTKIQDTDLDSATKKEYLEAIYAGLTGYTYLED